MYRDDGLPMRWRGLFCSVHACSPCSQAAREDADTAQSYPIRPVTLIVPFSAGGPTDVLARTLAASMGPTLGQSVVVENKPGAGGTIGAAYVARAQPDGYTLLLHHIGMATSKALYRNLTYDPPELRVRRPGGDVPMTLVGRQDLPPDTPQELFSTSEEPRDAPSLRRTGAVSHLCALLLQRALGVELTTVQFRAPRPRWSRWSADTWIRATDHADHSASTRVA
jgi:tripartite-type tricarboxylate transporter receptor subunit TctC